MYKIILNATSALFLLLTFTQSSWANTQPGRQSKVKITHDRADDATEITLDTSLVRTVDGQTFYFSALFTSEPPEEITFFLIASSAQSRYDKDNRIGILFGTKVIAKNYRYGPRGDRAGKALESIIIRFSMAEFSELVSVDRVGFMFVDETSVVLTAANISDLRDFAAEVGKHTGQKIGNAATSARSGPDAPAQPADASGPPATDGGLAPNNVTTATIGMNEKRRHHFKLDRGPAEFTLASTCRSNTGCSELMLHVFDDRNRPLKSQQVKCELHQLTGYRADDDDEPYEVVLTSEQGCRATVPVEITGSGTYSAVVQNNSANSHLEYIVEATPAVKSARPGQAAGNGGGAGNLRGGTPANRSGTPPSRGAATPGGASGAGREYPARAPGPPVVAKPPTVVEIIGGAEVDFKYGRFDRVIGSCLEVLKNDPDQPRGNLLLGMAYYQSRDYEKSVPYLAKAVALGEKVTFTVAHHRKVFAGSSDNGPDNDLSEGDLILHKDSLELRITSNTTKTGVRVSDESFRVPLSAVYELKHEANKEGRLKVEVGITGGGGAGKEKRRTYNFYPADARVESSRGKLLSLSKTEIRCVSCSPATKIINDIWLLIRK